MFVRVQTCTGLKAFLCSEFKTAVVAVGQNKLYVFVSMLQFYFAFHLSFYHKLEFVAGFIHPLWNHFYFIQTVQACV